MFEIGNNYTHNKLMSENSYCIVFAFYIAIADFRW